MSTIPPAAQDTQVGGDHYLKYAMQPMLWTTLNNVPAVLGRAVVYIMRYRDKNGLKDLDKASHCLKLYQQYHEQYGYRWKRDSKIRWHVTPLLFCRMNQLDNLQSRLICRISNIRHMPGADAVPNWDYMQRLLALMYEDFATKKAAPK